VATRLSFFSALAGALTAWLAFRVVRVTAADLSGSVAAVTAAALTALGLTFFRAATVPEVYASAAAALALAVLLWPRVCAGDARAGLVLAFLGGLSLGLHAHLRLLVGPAAIVLALLRLRRGDRWPLYAPAAVALGAAVVAYLPLRAARAPAANWANPRTLAGLVAHLSAARIRASFAGEMFHHVGAHLVFFARIVEAELGLPALLLAGVGLIWLCAKKERRALGVLLAVVLLGDALYSAALNPMALDDLQDGHPTALAIALLAASGVACAAARFSRAAPAAAMALAVLALTPAALADLDGKRGLACEAGRISDAALAEGGPRALLLLTSDDLLAGATYEQVVGGARPDVTVLARQQMSDLPDVAARIRRGGGEVKLEHHLPRLIASELPRREIFWEPGIDTPPVAVVPEVPLYRVSQSPWPDARTLAVRLEEILQPARDPTTRRLYATQLSSLGRVYLGAGDHSPELVDRAARFFEAALLVRPSDAVAATDLAVVRARRGDVRGALTLVETVLAHEPDRFVARLNAARYRLTLGDLDGAERDFRRAAAENPSDPRPNAGLAEVRFARRERRP
jgi:tetratricopeptide (TPR) repeat protein